MVKKLLIVSVAKGVKSNSLLFKTFSKTKLPVEITFIENNKDSLASVYNKFITEKYRDYIICFVHDDVCLADALLIDKVNKAIESYDVFGVAGGAGAITIQNNQPALWHLISKDKVGFAGHYDINTNVDDILSTCWVTNFGVSPTKANLIDGVFIGVNVQKLLDKNVTFDENCPARFHFYDLLLSVRSKKAGLRLGVVPIVLFHRSHGLTNVDNEFIQGDIYFKTYCNSLNDNS